MCQAEYAVAGDFLLKARHARRVPELVVGQNPFMGIFGPGTENRILQQRPEECLGEKTVPGKTGMEMLEHEVVADEPVRRGMGKSRLRVAAGKVIVPADLAEKIVDVPRRSEAHTVLIACPFVLGSGTLILSEGVKTPGEKVMSAGVTAVDPDRIPEPGDCRCKFSPLHCQAAGVKQCVPSGLFTVGGILREDRIEWRLIANIAGNSAEDDRGMVVTGGVDHCLKICRQVRTCLN